MPSTSNVWEISFFWYFVPFFVSWHAYMSLAPGLKEALIEFRNSRTIYYNSPDYLFDRALGQRVFEARSSSAFVQKKIKVTFINKTLSNFQPRLPKAKRKLLREINQCSRRNKTNRFLVWRGAVKSSWDSSNSIPRRVNEIVYIFSRNFSLPICLSGSLISVVSRPVGSDGWSAGREKALLYTARPDSQTKLRWLDIPVVGSLYHHGLH